MPKIPVVGRLGRSGLAGSIVEDFNPDRLTVYVSCQWRIERADAE